MYIDCLDKYNIMLFICVLNSLYMQYSVLGGDFKITKLNIVKRYVVATFF